MQRSEAQIIDEILEHYPAQLRAQARVYLEDRTASVGSNRPEVAGLLAELTTVRSKASLARQNTLVSTPVEEHFRLTVALVPNLAKAQAVVIRTPDDNGHPILLLREDATGADLAFGLSMAAQALAKYGDTPATAKRIEYTSHGRKQATHLPAKYDGGLALIRRTSPRDLPGIGQVRSMDMFAKK
jgi:hypothetical protein